MLTACKYKCAVLAAEEATRNLRPPGSKSRVRTPRDISRCGVQGPDVTRRLVKVKTVPGHNLCRHFFSE